MSFLPLVVVFEASTFLSSGPRAAEKNEIEAFRHPDPSKAFLLVLYHGASRVTGRALRLSCCGSSLIVLMTEEAQRSNENEKKYPWTSMRSSLRAVFLVVLRSSIEVITMT